MQPTTLALGTKRCRLCGSRGPWGALTGINGVSAAWLVLPDEELFMDGGDVPPTTLAPWTKRCKPCATHSACARNQKVVLSFTVPLLESQYAMPRVKTGYSSSFPYSSITIYIIYIHLVSVSVSKLPILRDQVSVSVSVSVGAFPESRYQSRYRLGPFLSPGISPGIDWEFF